MSRITEFGFDFGPMQVTRLIGDPKYGYVLSVKAGKNAYELRCSPTGRKLEAVRIDTKAPRAVAEAARAALEASRGTEGLAARPEPEQL